MTVEVQLRQDQYDYVVRYAGDELSRRIAVDQQPRVVRLSAEQRDALMSRMADRLQLAGFGQEYEPNEEGRLVESIIDALRGARVR